MGGSSRRPARADRSAGVERSGAPELDEAVVSPADLELVDRLRGGDETAFVRLVDRHQGAMLRLARNYVSTRAAAQEVVQETWLAVIEGLDRFEGRSTLKTWIFRILMNRAITYGRRERRSVPFSAAFDPATDPESAVDPRRFHVEGDPYPGGWITFPRSWAGQPEERLLSAETMAVIEGAMRDMPGAQREVLIMRDIEGMSHLEACNVLGVSETNQRVLLHRARGRVRRALEAYLERPDERGGRSRPGAG